MSTLKVAAINNPSAPSGGLVFSAGGNVTGAGMDLIVSQSFTAASTVSIDGCFTSDYDNYRVVIFATHSGASQVDLNCRMRASASDNSAANYTTQVARFENTTLTAARATGMTAWVLGRTIDSGSAYSVTFVGPDLAQPTALLIESMSSASTPLSEFRVNAHTASTAFDGFTIYPASGTITGTLRVYGYRN